jgi:glycine/D-amino acid oxidase-like deaminating enzyme
MRAVIVGNGVVALSAALRLAQRSGPGDSIVVVGPAPRPGSATLAAAAMLNSFAEVEAGSLDHPIDRTRFDLSRDATAAWPGFADELAILAGSPRCEACGGRCKGHLDTGSYVVNNTAADDLGDANFDAILAALKAYGEPHDRVAPRDIPNYRPAQRTRATRAVFVPREGWVNPRLLVRSLEASLDRLGVLRVDAAVDRLEHLGGLITAAVAADGRRWEGDRFLLAPGASCSDLLARSDLPLAMQRVFYGVGVSLELRSPDHPHRACVRTPNRGLACGVYSVPYAEGPGHRHDHLLVGATNFMSAVPHEHGRVMSVEALLRAAMEQVNAHFDRADLVRVNVGWRPTSQDTYPLVGPTSVPNLVVATGTKRDGIHLAPLLSRAVAAMVRGEPSDPRWEPFRPERPVLRPLTRAQAIDKAVRHQLNALYQHDFTPAKSRMPDQVRAMLRGDLERLHDQVGAVDWGIPPEMLDMYRDGHARA